MGDNMERVILQFFQLDNEDIEELRHIANLHNIEWINYLNELYNEFIICDDAMICGG